MLTLLQLAWGQVLRGGKVEGFVGATNVKEPNVQKPALNIGYKIEIKHCGQETDAVTAVIGNSVAGDQKAPVVATLVGGGDSGFPPYIKPQ